MSKFKWVLSTLLVTAMISSLPTGSTQTTKAQTNPFGTGEDVSQALTKDNEPPVNPDERRRTGTSRGNPWAAVFRALAQDNKEPLPPKKGVSRGGACAIAPRTIGSNAKIWSDRPLFVWQGRLSRLEVRPAGSDRVLWRYNVTESQNSTMYTGEPLKPGQTYEWSLYNLGTRDNSRPSATVRFQVMDAQERASIKTQLQDLDRELKEKGASPEEIARQRAQYFAQQRLWSDVVQEAYSVKNPSAPLAEVVQAIPREICTNPAGQNSVQSR
jgi:hypothetical protein